jgi:hypothetical protein
MVLHGLNDWNAINGNGAWIVVVAVSGILFLAYAKAPAHPARPAHHSSSLAGITVPPPGSAASYAPRHGVPPTQPPSPPHPGFQPQPHPQHQDPRQAPVPATHGPTWHPSPAAANHPPAVTVPPSPRKKPWWEE